MIKLHISAILSKFDKLLQTLNIVICNILFQPGFHARKSRDHFIISSCH